MSIKLAVLDDHEMFLQGLCVQLKEVPEFEILGEFTNSEQLLLFLRSRSIDILISDLMIKDIHGFELVKKIQLEVDPNMKIILLSGFYDNLYHKQALELGVRAFLPKEINFKKLIECIFDVQNGNYVIPETIQNGAKEHLLTDTEKEILKLIVEEKSNEEIARLLYLSRRTVESHVTNILQKLDVKSRVGAVREAVKLNLI